MNEKLEKAKALVNQGKYNKALLLVKKINQKQHQISFESLELEGRCLYLNKQYPLAEIKIKHSLSLIRPNVDLEKLELEAIGNLAVICEKQGKIDQAITWLKSYIQKDGSLHSANQRFYLIQLAFSNQDYQTVLDYAPILKNITEYSTQVLLLLADIAILQDDSVTASQYLDQVAVDVKTENRTVVPQQCIVSLLTGYHKLEDYKKERQLLEFLKPKFQHEAWFKRIYTQCEAKILKSCKAPLAIQNQVETKEVNSFSEVQLKYTYSRHNIFSNDQDVYQIIVKLKKELERLGAKYSKHLAIIEEAGNVSVHCDTELTHAEQIISVPIKCLPLASDFKLSLDNNLLKCTLKKHPLNPNAQTVMALLVDMYNACNKIEGWKNSSPLLAMAGHKQLFDKFISAVSNKNRYMNYYAESDKQHNEDLVIDSFIHSRLLTFSNEELRKVNIKSKNMFESAFIPLIELMNHQMGAQPFQKDDKGVELFAMALPGEAGREVFVQYNLDDPMVTLLVYGFVDQSANWIYSIPGSLKTKTGLTVNIDNFIITTNKDDIPNHLAGYSEYFPNRIVRENGIVSINKLIIPNKEHLNSLRLMIAHCLKTIDFEGIYANPDNLEVEVNYFEKQLLDFNLQHWHELQQMVTENQESKSGLAELTASQLQELCSFNISHIKQYQAAIGGVLSH